MKLKTAFHHLWNPATGWAALGRSVAESLRTRVAIVTVAFLLVVTCLAALMLVHQSEVQVHAEVRLHELDEVVQVASLLSHDLIKRQRMLALAAESLRADKRIDKSDAMRFLEDQSALLAVFTSVLVTCSRPSATCGCATPSCATMTGRGTPAAVPRQRRIQPRLPAPPRPLR